MPRIVSPLDSSHKEGEFFSEHFFQLLFARRLREAREAMQPKLGLKEAAELIGIQKGYLSDLENNKKIHPSQELFERICTEYAVPPAKLLGDDVRIQVEWLRGQLGTESGDPLSRFGLEPTRLYEIFGGDLEAILLVLRVLTSLKNRFGIEEEHIFHEINRTQLALKSERFRSWEEEAKAIRLSFKLPAEVGIEYEEAVTQALLIEGVIVHTTSLEMDGVKPVLESIFIPDRRTLLVDSSAGVELKCFVLTRELIHQSQRHSVRSFAHPNRTPRSLRTVQNDYVAWHLALSVLYAHDNILRITQDMKSARSVEDLIEVLLGFLNTPNALSPDLMLSRLVQVFKSDWNDQPYFLVMDRLRRVNNRPAYRIKSHLIPDHSKVRRLVHYERHCRRWLSCRLLERKHQSDHPGNENSKEESEPRCTAVEVEVPTVGKALIGCQRESFSGSIPDLIAIGVAYRMGGSDHERSASISFPVRSLPGLAAADTISSRDSVLVGQTCESCQFYDKCPDAEKDIVRLQETLSAEQWDDHLRRIQASLGPPSSAPTRTSSRR